MDSKNQSELPNQGIRLTKTPEPEIPKLQDILDGLNLLPLTYKLIATAYNPRDSSCLDNPLSLLAESYETLSNLANNLPGAELSIKDQELALQKERNDLKLTKAQLKKYKKLKI